jgi:hypothetical protein
MTLRASAAALAFLRARQRLDSAMQFFDLPADVADLLSDGSSHGLIQAVGHPQSMSP